MVRTGRLSPDHQRVEVLGVKITPSTIERAVDKIAGWIADDTRTYVCVTSVHGVVESLADPALRDIHNAAGMCTTDGMPLVWASKYAGFDFADRVYGPDLTLALAERAAGDGWKSYFYGAADGVAQRLGEELEERFPGFTTAGSFSPPFRPLTDAEEDDIVATINSSGADIVWVGLSTPKQERWMDAFRDRLDAPVLIGVGAAFDFHTGGTKQAPYWIQRSGFEWLFRLTTEPKRLWRRYLLQYPKFVTAIVRDHPESCE